MNIIAFIDGTMKKYEGYKDLFQELSGLDYVISSVEDGIIKAKLGDEEKEITFGELVVDSVKDKFIFDISEYKDNLKESVASLKKQGLLDNEKIKKLGEQFAFLKAK